MWYPEPYLDSIITKCDFIQEHLFNTFSISKIWLQFVMRQGVPVRNSRSGEPSGKIVQKETNMIYIHYLMTSSLQTSVTVFVLKIKVLYKWNSCRCYSTEVKALKWIKRMKAITTKMKQDRRYLKMKTPGCCAFQQQFLGPPSSSPLFCCQNSQGHNLPIRHYIHQVD